MSYPFTMLDETSKYIKDSIGSNPNEVVKHVVATRDCIMRNGPSNHCLRLSPIEMSVDIFMEGFLAVFIQDPEFRNKDDVFIHDVALQFIIALIQHYNENNDVCDKFVDSLMNTYYNFKIE